MAVTSLSQRFVGHLAEAAWHHPDIAASYAFVIVKLVTHSAKGITDKDFELAKRIDAAMISSIRSTASGFSIFATTLT